MRRLLGLIGLVSLLLLSQAQAATLYVNNTVGCPGSGTTGSPYCSITEAFNNVVAGDTIAIRSGTGIYDGFFFTSGKPGPITIEPDAGASFILRNCNAGAGEAAIQVKNSNDWTVRNLIFDGSGCATVPSLYALKIQGDSQHVTGIVVSGNVFRNWRQTAAGANGPNVLNIGGCDTAFGCGANFNMTATISGNLFENIDLIAIKPYRMLNSVIQDNEIRGLRCGRQTSGAAETVGIHYTYGNTGLIIRRNHIHDYTGYLACPLASQGFFTVAGIWCDVNGGGNSGTLIYDNVIHDLDAGKSGFANPNGTDHSATAIFIEEGCAGHKVYNNVIYNVGSRGLRNSFHPSGATTAAANEYSYNSIYASYQGIYLLEGVTVVKNNLVKFCGSTCIILDSPATAVWTINNNLYDDGATQTKIGQINPGSPQNFTNWKIACSCDANSINADPLLAVIP